MIIVPREARENLSDHAHLIANPTPINNNYNFISLQTTTMNGRVSGSYFYNDCFNQQIMLPGITYEDALE